jgi:MFS family permease
LSETSFKFRVLAAAAGSAALFLAALDFSINVSLPVFRDSLNETLVSVQWIIIIYHAARSGTGFIAGHLADTVGLKRVLLFGVIIYTASVAVISLQGSLAPVVALRVPQGIGVAILFTVGPAVVARAFGPQRRGTALGVTLGAMGAGQMAGTLGGGWLSLNIGWEAIFWARVPIGIATFALVLVAVREARSSRSPFDWRSGGTVFVFLFVLVLALSFARIDGWFALRPVLLYIGSAAVLALVAWRHRVSLHPVFPASLLRETAFRAGVASNLLVTTGTFVMWFLFPFFVSDVMDRSTLVLGALLATMAGSSLLGSTAGGWVADMIGDRKSTVAGAAIAASGLMLVGGMTGASAVVAVAGAGALLGFGFGAHQAAVYALTLRHTAPEQAGAASAALAVAQTVGTVMSIAIMTSLFSWRVGQSGSAPGSGQFLDAYGVVLPVAAAVTLAGGLVALITAGLRRRSVATGGA